MSVPGAFVARNAKAVVSVIGGIVNVLAVSVALFQFAPVEYAGVGAALLVMMEALRSANVWIVRNEPALVAAIDEIVAPEAG
ncbi:hypothetical protein ACFXHA_21720 [Nocardia sp. NPDC059240]|uniref:hypothetical protein n=1 Tax=Nocardia sp. NPDC059240 TaxID=3346786 RepID=UPI003683D665